MIRIIAADQALSDNETPLDPRTTFDTGLQRFYLFISFRNMQNGVVWSRVLFRDGEPLQGGGYVWTLGADGSGYFFFGNTDGYEPGDYEVRLYLEDQEVTSFSFEVVP